jgi:hypothetical protein
MSIEDNTSENTPVIKSRTGKFLQSMFDKKAPTAPRTRPTATSQEFMQVVPEPSTWDEGEESNWDDDFVEAPQPGFVTPQNPPPPTNPVAAPPPPPPSAKVSNPENIADISQGLSALSTEAKVPPAPPRPLEVKENPETARPQPIAEPATIEVSIPRPKNIKYKTKDPNAEPLSTAPVKTTAAKNEAIELDIQRPKNIKYKTKPPVKASLPERLLAPIKSLFAKIRLPNTAKISTEQAQASESTSNKKSWQLPSLGSENFRQILGIAGAVFLAMTVAWAVINFWPRSTTTDVVAVPPPPVIQPVPATPKISPEVALLEAVKNRSQTLASLYPAGLIANLELDPQKGLATVIVGNLWFNLTPEQQQQTAQSLWQQARSYQMTGLEVRATTDRLVARSPFVGTEAVLTSG